MTDTLHEFTPSKVLNFYQGDHAITGAPIENIDVGSIDGQNLRLGEGSAVFIRSANVLGEMDDSELSGTLNYYRSVLAREGKLHIYEPYTPQVFGQRLMGLLARSGFSDVKPYDPSEDFSAISGTSSQGVQPAALLLDARFGKERHTHDRLLSRVEFEEKCSSFRETYPNVPKVSWIVAVYNEERNLPHFLSFLETAMDATGMDREFIFVVNGCTDKSEEMLRKFVKTTDLKASLTHSELGILPAFKHGIAQRSHEGFVGRFDADIILHPQTLDLLQMHLVENTIARVTYAEPLTLESETIFNTAAHHPEVMTKRLYYTGKTSLYRQNPYLEDGVSERPPQLVADDIFTSFNFIYRKGFSAITRAPHAVVYEKVVGNFDDLVKQTSRANSEITRVFKAYPHFRILGDLVQQDVAPGEYHDLLKAAEEHSFYVDDWSRLKSTK